MIGYYAHHHGSGHVHRAMAIAAELEDEVVILSSVACPAEWHGEWIRLPLDTDRAAADRDAGGAYHFVPVGSVGLSTRMSMISAWLQNARPSVVVVDVSAEVASMVRLHGVRVVVVAQPGRRVDPAHTHGYQLADAIIGCWPPSADPWEADASVQHRIEAIGGLSRMRAGAGSPRTRTRIAVLHGRGNREESRLDRVSGEARSALPDIEWVILREESPQAVAEALATSAFVFSHCGENAVAEVAAFRIPAVLVPEPRPFDEQVALARTLASADLPVRVITAGDHPDWNELTTGLASQTGDGWGNWVDGGAASRAARVVRRVANKQGRAA